METVMLEELWIKMKTSEEQKKHQKQHRFYSFSGCQILSYTNFVRRTDEQYLRRNFNNEYCLTGIQETTTCCSTINGSHHNIVSLYPQFTFASRACNNNHINNMKSKSFYKNHFNHSKNLLSSLCLWKASCSSTYFLR